ncbi:MAG: ABC transporter permease [Gemmatimonadota bacterium]|nr:MAG: ABC transporter permease [Gemmatimonadota bacterium]
MTGIRSALIRKEIREILRDRRAIVLSFLLPIFIYPVTFSFTSWLDRRDDAKTVEQSSRVAIHGELPTVRDALQGDQWIEVVATGNAPAALTDGRIDAWIDASQGWGQADSVPTIRLVFDATQEPGRVARDRVEAVLEQVREDESNRRYRDAGGQGALSDRVILAVVDVATEAETGGARAGQLIPMLLIMTLFVGGGTLSTDLVAGEKERGTLETLYLAPVPRSHIAFSKFMVVWGATAITGSLNLLSMLYCYRAGLITDSMTGNAGGLAISGAGVALSFVLIPPLAALVGGVLLGVSALARSLREAQLYLAPAMLLAMIPGLLATGQHVQLTPFTALLPLTNVALAIRDGLLAPVPAGLFVLVCLASIGWGLVATRWTTGILSREDTILGFDPEPFFARSRAGRRRAAFVGMSATVLIFFYLGALAQARDVIWGLVFTLWLLLPLLGAGTLRLAWSGGSLVKLLSLRRPRPGALLGGAFLGAGLVVPIRDGVYRLQQLFLPTPVAFGEELAGSLDELTLGWTILLFAVSPGIMEEMVFRGAFLGLLRRIGSTRSAVLISSAFFGVIHLSVFRFLPTFIIGLVAGTTVVRAGALLPAMVLHAVYNSLAIASDRLPESAQPLLAGGLAGWGASLILLAGGAMLIRRQSRGDT